MYIKTAIGATALLFSAVITVHGAGDAAVEQRVTESRAAATSLMQALKSELQAAMKAGGPVKAIGVCHTRAGSITEARESNEGLRIRRTSLKVRNPANAPDAWETSILERFETRKAAGEDVRTMEYHEIVEVDDGQLFRWMKAIPTGEVCLACHGGDRVSPDVVVKLGMLYPHDQARGFALGDIRGAFSVSWPLN